MKEKDGKTQDILYLSLSDETTHENNKYLRRKLFPIVRGDEKIMIRKRLISF
jgi:hypothetical protein